MMQSAKRQDTLQGKWARLLCALLALLLLCGCAAGANGDGAQDGAGSTPGATDGGADSAAGESTPLLGAFTSYTLDGDAVDESLLDGYQVIMLNFWATYCGPCIREMPALGELAGEYADKGVLIVGVPTDLIGEDGQIVAAQLSAALEIRETTGADYPHILPCSAMQAILQQIYAVPTTVFLDADGCQLGEVCMGAREKEDWVDLLDERLAQVNGDAA